MNYLALAGGIAIACAVDAFLIEPNWLRLEKVTVPMVDLPVAFEGYRIALLSDFHYSRWTNAAFVRRALALAMRFQPDLIALPGDFCDKHRHQPTVVPSLAGLFDGVEAPDGIVGTLGNHDHWLDADGVRAELLRNTPVRLIENTSMYVARGGARMAIGGVGDLWEGEVRPEQAFASVPRIVPRLLLSHNPDLAQEIDPTLHIDLMLAGHTHGGQVRIPFGPAPQIASQYGNKFRAGLVQGKGCQVYVTRGVCSTRHLRFWCPPEVSGITLTRARA